MKISGGIIYPPKATKQTEGTRNVSHEKKTISDQLDDAMEIIRKRNAELSEANARIRAMHRENDTAENIRTRIFNLAARDPDPPTWLKEIRGPNRTQEVPAVIWSDWHYGEKIVSAEVGGVNEFNAEIAQRRVKKLVNDTIDVAYHHTSDRKQKFPGAIVCLGGDMITGDIHDELRATNDRTPQEAINDLTDHICGALEMMATHFGRLFVPAVVGNHARDSMKPRMKGRVFTSHEWVIYCNLKRHFRKTKSIQFLIPSEADAYFEVFSHRFLLTHGDSLGVKGGDGIIGAIGPIMRGTLKVRNSEKQVGRDIDTVVMGHWHQYIALRRVIVNNSLIGYNEFAKLGLRAEYSTPSQAFWLCHPKYGITAQREIFVDDKKQSLIEKPWISWQE